MGTFKLWYLSVMAFCHSSHGDFRLGNTRPPHTHTHTHTHRMRAFEWIDAIQTLGMRWVYATKGSKFVCR